MESHNLRIALFVSSILPLAACSSVDEHASPRASNVRASLGAANGVELGAKVVSVTTSGELCPPNSLVTVYESLINVTTDVSATCEEPEDYDPPLRSLAASCVVTVELEIPEGNQIGVPYTEWTGYGSEILAGTRSYSFQGGESTGELPILFKSASNFNVRDRGFAIFSPTCDGSHRTRLVTTLQADLVCKGLVKLDSVNIYTTWRTGTDFRGCAGGEGGKTPGLLEDWCGGSLQRTCASGLACEFTEANLNWDGSGRQGATGTCVDPNERPEVAEEGESCGGVRNIPCATGSLCWHMPNSTPDWRGRCVHDPLPERGACHFGVPRLECAAPAVCYEPTHRCVNAQGRHGDPCGEPYLPECVAPAQCQQQWVGTEDSEIPIGICIDPSARSPDSGKI